MPYIEKDENVTAEMQIYISTVAEYTPKTVVYQDRNHIVVPVIMMVEGVHAGSAGPLLHRKEDLGRFPASWDGIPVMIDHPQIDGYNVSANIPEVLENSVGRVFNTKMTGEKLRAEIWFDEQKLIAIAPTVCAMIQEGKTLEVSVGVFTDEEEGEGAYLNTNTNEEETYKAIAKNHRPDHLAVLPNDRGACSVKDGCGIRVNKANSGVTVKPKEDVMNREVLLTMRQIAQEQLMSTITDNKQGFQELIGKVSDAVSAMDGDEEYNWVAEVYDDAVIYQKRVKDNGEGSGWFQQTYQINATGNVELTGDPKRVRREVSYVQVNKLKRTIFNTNKKGDQTMPENKPCCLEKVVELLNNKQLGLTEADDREWLLELGPERLARLTPKAPEVIEVNKTVEVQLEPDLTAYVKRDSIKTAEDVLAVVPEEMKEQFTAGLALHTAHRADLVKAILDNSEVGAWTEDELKVHNTAMLEKLSKQFKQPVSYAGQAAGGGLSVNTEQTDILLPLDVK